MAELSEKLPGYGTSTVRAAFAFITRGSIKTCFLAYVATQHLHTRRTSCQPSCHLRPLRCLIMFYCERCTPFWCSVGRSGYTVEALIGPMALIAIFSVHLTPSSSRMLKRFCLLFGCTNRLHGARALYEQSRWSYD